VGGLVSAAKEWIWRQQRVAREKKGSWVFTGDAKWAENGGEVQKGCWDLAESEASRSRVGVGGRGGKGGRDFWGHDLGRFLR
jgi:hypothetical protein